LWREVRLPDLCAPGRPTGAGWVTVTHGRHVPAREDSFDHRLHALASVLLADTGLTHVTAARVLGWWLPPLPQVPAFAAGPTSRNRPRRAELRMIRTTPAPTITWIDGLPLVSPEDVLLACARHLGLIDVVVLVDSALRSGDTTFGRLARAVSARRFGVRRLRLALALADPRSESPYETLLRLLHVACEVAVEPQHELWHGGSLQARGDLWVVGTTSLHEYDGGDHRRDKERHRKDLRRDRAVANTGWVRRGYTDVELLRQPLTILRDADLSLGRTHDPARIQVWYSLLRESCFTAAGRRLFRQRLRLPERPS
jgi:hypothetical protein